MPMVSLPPDLRRDERFARLLVSSHNRLLGRQLVKEEALADQARWLYEDAPFCVLAHDAGAEPRFVYANRTAQALFEYDWDSFVGLPSRLSAGPSDRAERERLLSAVSRQGFIDGYAGIRVARSGRRFRIENTRVWNIIDDSGDMYGQAAAFGTWTFVSS